MGIAKQSDQLSSGGLMAGEGTKQDVGEERQGWKEKKKKGEEMQRSVIQRDITEKLFETEKKRSFRPGKNYESVDNTS